MPILVTGATGFVPANVVAHLVSQGRDVVAFHQSPLDPAMEATLRAAGSGRTTFVQGDTRNERAVESLFAEHRPEGVLHMAAMTPMDTDVERRDARRIVATNVAGTLNVLLASAGAGVRRVVFLSSASVYAPSVVAAPVTESSPVRDDGGLYPLTKLAGEQLCRWTTATLGLDVRAVRMGAVYGPWERPTNSRQRMSSVWQAVHEALAGRPLRCNNASLVRDWIHAADAAGAIVTLHDAPALRHDVYNLTGGVVTMERTLAAVASAVPGASIEWVAREEDANVPVPEIPTRGPLDASRLRADTPWTPRYDIESGINHYVRVLSALDEC